MEHFTLSTCSICSVVPSLYIICVYMNICTKIRSGGDLSTMSFDFQTFANDRIEVTGIFLNHVSQKTNT